MTTDDKGWHYDGVPEPGKDCRCIVTLQEAGMEWVGIRAYNHTTAHWLNGGEPERAKVHAWMPLPQPARGYWARGILKFPAAQPSQPQPPAALEDRFENPAKQDPIDTERFAKAPCYLCGYNGRGYYQPQNHPCAGKYHAAIDAAMEPE